MKKKNSKADDRVSKLNLQLTQNQISRRDFIIGAVALGFSIPVASFLADNAEANVPKKGGQFKIGVSQGNTSDSLDPATFNNHNTILIAYSMLNYLTTINNKNELVGELAESWDVTPDAKKWTFKLRKGVEFHNGKTLDSKDVIASINHHRGSDSKSMGKGLLQSIESIKADGLDTVVVELISGNADFPALLTDYHYGIMPSDASGQMNWKSGAGTGCYVVDEYQPGVVTLMKRFPNYWKKDVGHFSEVKLIPIADPATRTSALKAGTVDAIDRCDLKTIQFLEKDPKLAVDEVPSGAHFTFPMNTTVEPFNNNDVRLALKHAIDREEILKKILHGHGVIGNDHPIGVGIKYHAKDLPQRAYDPDKAKYYLKKAGLDRLQVELHGSDMPFAGAMDAIVLYQQSALRANIGIKPIRMPNDGYYSNVWMKLPWAAAAWGARPTADMMFSIAYGAEAPWNDTFWKHKHFNQLLTVARAELDDKKRIEMYAEMQQICRDEGGAVIPVFESWVHVRRKNVMHEANLESTWPLDGMKAPERWWFS